MLELLGSGMPVTGLAATQEFLDEHRALVSATSAEILVATEAQLVQAGTFASNKAALAWAPIPEAPSALPSQSWVLALDDVRDPGNLGTLLRIADWYGLKEVVCSPTTAELWNPKVLHASMGSFTRVRVWYLPLETYLPQANRPVFGALLDGENVHTQEFTAEGILLMGNEAQGIAPDLMPHITHQVSIPRFGGAESLNVAAATAVLCDNLRRHQPH